MGSERSCISAEAISTRSKREQLEQVIRPAVHFHLGQAAQPPDQLQIFQTGLKRVEHRLLGHVPERRHQALQAATLRPAEYLGMEARLGSIAPGKLADLVLLSANPLADIANTRRIEAVIQDGRIHSKPELQRMLGRR